MNSNVLATPKQYGKRLGFRKSLIGQAVNSLPKEAQEKYYAEAAQVHDAHVKAIYAQEQMFKSVIKELEVAKENALAQALHNAITVTDVSGG